MTNNELDNDISYMPIRTKMFKYRQKNQLIINKEIGIKGNKTG